MLFVHDAFLWRSRPSLSLDGVNEDLLTSFHFIYPEGVITSLICSPC